jgi:hypothetical protein
MVAAIVAAWGTARLGEIDSGRLMVHTMPYPAAPSNRSLTRAFAVTARTTEHFAVTPHDRSPIGERTRRPSPPATP